MCNNKTVLHGTSCKFTFDIIYYTLQITSTSGYELTSSGFGDKWLTFLQRSSLKYTVGWSWGIKSDTNILKSIKMIIVIHFDLHGFAVSALPILYQYQFHRTLTTYWCHADLSHWVGTYSNQSLSKTAGISSHTNPRRRCLLEYEDVSQSTCWSDTDFQNQPSQQPPSTQTVFLQRHSRGSLKWPN